MNSLNYISKDDFYEVKLGSMLASYDRDTLTMLYQPIVGYAGIALYFTLWSEVKRAEFSSPNKHDVIIKVMGIDLTTFLNARRSLEAIGLLKTFKESIANNTDSYIYELYAPKSPEEFFNDVIYKGLLSKKIGARAVKTLSLIFASKPNDENVGKEITAKFAEVYNIDEDETLKVMSIKTKRGRKTITIASSFDINELFTEIKKMSPISPEAFTTDDSQEIMRLATLFGMDVLAMAEVVLHVYNENSINHLDYKELYNLCSKYKDGLNIKDSSNEIKEYSEKDELGKKLNIINNYSAFDYLKLKQGFSNPSPADVKIINILSEKYGFNSAVINTIIDYTLTVCDNELPLPYVEKIAATLKRKQITTALAALNALHFRRKKNENYNKDSITENDSNSNDKEVVIEDLGEFGDL